MLKRWIFAAAAAAVLAAGALTPADAETKKYRVGYNIYVGFMPYGWMAENGILDKWADKYGIEIEVIQVADYVGGINQFVARDLDAMSVASMDGLTIRPQAASTPRSPSPAISRTAMTASSRRPRAASRTSKAKPSISSS
ncbi:MAG: hypothetical protein AAGF51_04260 [Pseudomonadota bacterium]